MTPIVYLNSNNNKSLLAFGATDIVSCGVGDALNSVNRFINKHAGAYLFGYLGYDLKNEIEVLSSGNNDNIGFPDLFFFRPKYVVEINENISTYKQGKKTDATEKFIRDFFSNQKADISPIPISLKERISKETYFNRINELKKHLQSGDVYEITFCQEFYAENVTINPLVTYQKLNQKTNAPFSCYLELDGKYLLSGSPERFLRKKGRTLTSQPIKGTARRGKNPTEDKHIKEQLLSSKKERAENVMIVDLVRNDLSRIAVKNSVRVEELLGVYSFPTVHQLISTVSAEHKNNIDFKDIIKALFPMGSMTGAPKISAMKLIEQYEDFKRGLFSGTVGYIEPNGDFDFNVIIRSILYNSATNYISCPVGGAITIQSDKKEEYEECMLKVAAMMQILNGE